MSSRLELAGFIEALTVRMKPIMVELGRAANEAAAQLNRFGLQLLLSDDVLIEMGVAPSVRYQLAGSPYGRNGRGKKRWLLEKKEDKRRTHEIRLHAADCATPTDGQQRGQSQANNLPRED